MCLTIWRVDISDVSVMRLLARPQSDSSGTANGRSGEVIDKRGALVDDVLLQFRHV